MATLYSTFTRRFRRKNMQSIDQTFGFSDSGNTEILDAWFDLAIHNGYSKEILPKIEQFLIHVGRRKFLTPLYRAFKETGQLETARMIYDKAKGITIPLAGILWKVY